MNNGHSFFNLLQRAISGEREALELIIEAYMPLVISHSYVNGVFDEDCRQFLLLRMMIAIRDCKIEKF